MAQGVGIGLGLNAYSLLQGAIGGVGDAIKAASDKNEQLAKTGVVFGDLAGEVKEWAKAAAQSMGISERAALSSVSTFGNLFQAMGTGRQASKDMAQGLVELAADLASFNNANPDEVLVALQAAMVGQVEPMRRYGAEVSAARVEVKALEMGLGDASGALTVQDKIAARYAIIMADTATAQGDFARTSDGLANSTRIMNATLDDATAKLGQEMLPVVTELVQAVTNDLIPAMDNAEDGLNNFAGTLDRAALDIHNALGHAFSGFFEDFGAAKFEETASEWSKFQSKVVGKGQQTAEDLREIHRLIPAEARAAFVAGASEVEEGARKMLRPLNAEAKQAKEDAIARMSETPGDIAGALRDGYDAVEQGMEDLLEGLKNPIPDAKRLVRLESILVSQEVKDGLRSKDSEVRLGTIAMMDGVRQQIALLKSQMPGYAEGAAHAFGARWAAMGAYFQQQTAIALEGIRTYLRGQSPPKEGPLKDIDKWGYNLMVTFASGFRSGATLLGSAARAVAAVVRRVLADNVISAQEFMDATFGSQANVIAAARMIGGDVADAFADSLQDRLDDALAQSDADAMFVNATAWMKDRLSDVAARVKDLAKGIWGDVAKQIKDARGSIKSGFDDMLEGLKDPVSRTQEIVNLRAMLQTAEFRAAQTSDDPYLRARARDLEEQINARLAFLLGNAAEDTYRAGQTMAERAREAVVAIAVNSPFPLSPSQGEELARLMLPAFIAELRRQGFGFVGT